MKNKSLSILLVIVALGAILGAGGGAYLALMHDMPQIRSLEKFNPRNLSRSWGDYFRANFLYINVFFTFCVFFTIIKKCI